MNSQAAPSVLLWLFLILSGIFSPLYGDTTNLTEGRLNYCSVLYYCDLPVPGGHCPSKQSLGKPKVNFDAEQCRVPKLLFSRGVTPTVPDIGYRLYRYLGMEYRVVYEVVDSVQISPERLAYLLNDIPLAARLISHFQKEPYSATYLDGAKRKHFQGEKGKRLKGDVRHISGDTEERRLFYFGYGSAEVAWWRLRGPALMDFSYKPVGNSNKRVAYNMHILVFPGNGFVNGIMNLGMFKNIVFGKIREVIVDITEAARKMEAAGREEVLKHPGWTLEERLKLEAFLKLP